jgi:ribonuclease HII
MFEDESNFKNQGFQFVLGIDEAGRGPLAGPVVASAVALKEFEFDCKITDSKKLSPKRREEAFDEISQKAYVGVGIVDQGMIDKINILEATFFAMNKAVEDLISHLPKEVTDDVSFPEKVILLIDGNRFKTRFPYNYRTIIKGDLSVFSISCASIIAKVTRDRIVDKYDQKYPEYGFKNHKGYGTLQHRNAIKEHGLLDIHRKSFCRK